MKTLNLIWAGVKFSGFILWSVLQIPTLLLVASFWRGFGVAQFRVFAWVCCHVLFRIRLRASGELSRERPLLIVSNHISLFELLAFPALWKCRFFGKADVAKYFLLGRLAGNFGTLFIDRNPAKAVEGVELIRKNLIGSKTPFVIFPEGTTSNGDHILPFKSAMFDFLKNVPDAKIQPIAMIYRDRRGGKIPPQLMADEYACFVNAKQLRGPYAGKELSFFSMLFLAAAHNGFSVEMRILPQFDWTGMDRKQIAAALHDLVNAEFQKIRQ